MQTPFDILGVPPSASQAEILRAYRTHAQIFHPDRWHDASPNVQEAAARLMQQLNAAYESLSTPSRNNGWSRRTHGNGWGGATPPRPPPSPAADVAWDKAVRERQRRAADAAAERRAREASAVNGKAVARPRGPRSPTAVHAGLGEALVTNRIPCRGCRSIQWLPDDWRTSFDDVVYHCSVCDAVLLAHRPR
ncbi:MAG: J domain-containing protein [Acidimicrobiales bacterium]